MKLLKLILFCFLCFGTISAQYKNDLKFFPPETFNRKVELSINVPWINQWYIDKQNRYGKITGFFGLGVELGFKSNGKTISASISHMLDFPLPIPVALEALNDSAYLQESCRSTEFIFNYGVVYKEFWIKTGICYITTTYERYYYLSNPLVNNKFNRIGLNLNISREFVYTPIGSIILELGYSPTFISFELNRPKYKYQHLLNLNIEYRINLLKR